MGLDRAASAGFNSPVIAVVGFSGVAVNLWTDWRKNGFDGLPSARIRAIVAALGAMGLLLILAAQPAQAATDKLLNPSEDAIPSFGATTLATQQTPTTQLNSTQLRPRELNDSPMAPLPPALVAGPIGIFLATWTAHRANRRGGKI
jgi:hypothetical protein